MLEPASLPSQTSGALLSRLIKDETQRLGFDAVGITLVEASAHAAFLNKWLKAGYHGEMEYLGRAAAIQARIDPRTAWPALRSAIVVGLNYYTEPAPGGAIIARYAQGRDYHKVIKARLLRLLTFIEAQVGQPLPAARAYVDTGPVLERELARKAGLGWFGRNTMLIHPKRGSYFFLGSLLLELELEPDLPFEEDHCGTCSACVSACPTGALLGRDESGAPVMDARLCISYLTIENRGPIPRELRPLLGSRIYGCDICQEVCPWNQPKFVQLTTEKDFAPRAHVSGRALIELMQMDEAAWDEFSRGSAIRRARRSGFLRNVAVALGNWGAPEAVPVLCASLEDVEPLVRGHVAWALGRIGGSDASAALSNKLLEEADQGVSEEISAALDALMGQRPRGEA